MATEKQLRQQLKRLADLFEKAIEEADYTNTLGEHCLFCSQSRMFQADSEIHHTRTCTQRKIDRAIAAARKAASA